jgi:hypothetical protein
MNRLASLGSRRKTGTPQAYSTEFMVLRYDAGIDPTPRRTGPAWKQFLTAPAAEAKAPAATFCGIRCPVTPGYRVRSDLCG